MSGVHKGTVVRGESDCPLGALHITDCHDTVIYALAPLQVGGEGRGMYPVLSGSGRKPGMCWEGGGRRGGGSTRHGG